MIADTPKIDLKVLAAPAASKAISSTAKSAAGAVPAGAAPAGVGGAPFELERAIPVFHRWIQERALDELMVDVADYTHVPGGPGVILVCHDAIYSLDGGGGELGLLYSRRRETHPALGAIASLDDRLASVFRRALQACELLEREHDLGGLRFPGDRFQLAVNDRRVTARDAGELAAALERLGGRLFPGEQASIEVHGGDGDRLAATLRRERAAGTLAGEGGGAGEVRAHGVGELLTRLEAGVAAGRVS